ncbi:hypothetical protein EV426DRAFT_620049 [Tirmania nivea]|nr:hypothetical protein EV426DRAFT_620049 [Tirmania nivea]
MNIFILAIPFSCCAISGADAPLPTRTRDVDIYTCSSMGASERYLPLSQKGDEDIDSACTTHVAGCEYRQAAP